MHRPIATCRVWRFTPALLSGRQERPLSHAPFLEVHLMGIERSMFRNDLTRERYNQAVVIEWMYRRNGLVTEFSLN